MIRFRMIHLINGTNFIFIHYILPSLQDLPFLSLQGAINLVKSLVLHTYSTRIYLSLLAERQWLFQKITNTLQFTNLILQFKFLVIHSVTFKKCSTTAVHWSAWEAGRDEHPESFGLDKGTFFEYQQSAPLCPLADPTALDLLLYQLNREPF